MPGCSSGSHLHGECPPLPLRFRSKHPRDYFAVGEGLGQGEPGARDEVCTDLLREPHVQVEGAKCSCLCLAP